MAKKIYERIIGHYFPFFLRKVKAFPILSKYLIITADISFVAISFFLSFYIRYILFDDLTVFQSFYLKLLICVGFAGLFFYIFNTHSDLIRYTSCRNILRIFVALLCTYVCTFLTIWIFHVFLNFSVITTLVGLLFCFILSLCIIFICRTSISVFYDFSVENGDRKDCIPLLIYGIEAVHIGIANMIRLNEHFPYKVVGFISPEPLSFQHNILGLKIYSTKEVFTNQNKQHSIKAVLVFSDDLKSEKNKEVIKRFINSNINVMSISSRQNPYNIPQMQKIKIEDLLGRSTITTDITSIGKSLENKTVLITGAAGSIGSEIVRQLSRFNLEMLVLIDTAESPLHQLALDLKGSTNVPFHAIIADVRNKKRMESIFDKYRPHHIYHAAAYKHVPMMEQHPSEAVITNVLGTQIVADLTVAYRAECFVLISTDKAVNPSNVMGASKRIAEIYIQSLSTFLKSEETPNIDWPRFITTRFGNVLGSNGSVIPLFTKQIAEGGPITLTHPDIIRYFMTIPEACSLVLEAGNIGKGGELFIFDMGESVKIKDMAEEMIRLSGLTPHKDINIVYTGLRPGEKLHEELLHNREKMKPTHNKKIMIGRVRQYDYLQVCKWVDRLMQTADACDENDIVKIMKKIVPEFLSNNSEYEVLDKATAVTLTNRYSAERILQRVV